MRESSPSLTPCPLLGKDLNIDRQAQGRLCRKRRDENGPPALGMNGASPHQKKSTALICRSVPSAIIKM
jgi:hypothetical protein